MIRSLAMIAAAGLFLAVVAISTAVTIAGPEAAKRGWSSGFSEWGNHWWRGPPGVGRGVQGPAGDSPTTRTLAWSGADRLAVDLDADVRYVQASGPASVTISGPARIANGLTVRGDTLRLPAGQPPADSRVTIVVRAPNIRSFDVAGRTVLTIENLNQKRLALDVQDSAAIIASGDVDEIDLDLSSSGDADLSRLQARRAFVDVDGAGTATIAPTARADLGISGAGDIRLLTRPARLVTKVSGPGRILQGAPAPAQPGG
ncbi:MAG: DUF2807 domain-containing protein [Caulobacterales bacterium]|nr:DUF2807 domain-containing protein [Caulobacterales bacterium]